LSSRPITSARPAGAKGEGGAPPCPATFHPGRLLPLPPAGASRFQNRRRPQRHLGTLRPSAELGDPLGPPDGPTSP
jgi:hypothetical protein